MLRCQHPFIFIASLVFLAVTACGSPKDCDVGFEEGDQFRFTVIEKIEATGDGCGDENLEFQAEDTFILEGGQLWDLDRSGACDIHRSAKANPPAPWSEVVHDCLEVSTQLGQECKWKDGCGGTIWFAVTAVIRQGKPIEDGVVWVDWAKQCGEVPVVQCVERYSVRIERL